MDQECDDDTDRRRGPLREIPSSVWLGVGALIALVGVAVAALILFG
jgi:hypothetical protein